jgi:hypothetical protein
MRQPGLRRGGKAQDASTALQMTTSGVVMKLRMVAGWCLETEVVMLKMRPNNRVTTV